MNIICKINEIFGRRKNYLKKKNIFKHGNTNNIILYEYIIVVEYLPGDTE